MRCPACGRHMVERGTHLECPNILCDYEEEVDSKVAVVKPKQWLPIIVSNHSAPTL